MLFVPWDAQLEFKNYRMKTIISQVEKWALRSVLSILLAASWSAKGDTLTFESFSPGQDWVGVPNGYGGLQWNNFGVICGACQSVNSGYHAAPVSPANVVFNLHGSPASISVSSNVFDLNSAYLTAALNLDSTVQVRVQGFLGATRLYDTTNVVNKYAPAFVNFNYVGVDRVTFSTTPSVQFAMDDLDVSFPGACSFSISPGGRLHGSAPETGSVSVATQTNCAWNVTTTNGWVTILSAPSNTNAGTVTYALSENASTLRRSGVIEIAGQAFSLTQLGIPAPPIVIGPIEVSTLGHSSFGGIPGFPGSNTTVTTFYLIDQNQNTGGGGVLPSLSVDWDTNTQFKVTVAAPAGNKFAVQVPAGSQVGFGGFLWWESPGRGGFSPAGPVTAEFEGLEGTAPLFSGSDAVLSSSHGFFGFFDLEGTTVAGDFSFTAITLTGTVLPQYTGNGSENFTPHHESKLFLHCPAVSTNLVTIVPTDPAPALRIDSISSEGVALSVRGRTKSAGRPVVIECSEDLAHWTALSTNVVPCTIVDTAGRNLPRRFYRTRELP